MGRRVGGRGKDLAQVFGSRLEDPWHHVCAARTHHSRLGIINSPSHIGYNRRLSDQFACTFVSFVLCEKNVHLPRRRRRRRAARALPRCSKNHALIVSETHNTASTCLQWDGMLMGVRRQKSRANCYAEPDILAAFCMNRTPISFSAIVPSRRNEARRCIGKHILLTERQPSEPLRPRRAPFVRFLSMP